MTSPAVIAAFALPENQSKGVIKANGKWPSFYI